MSFFRIAKTFEVEYGHRLSKHPEKCRFPHGHSLKIEVVARGRHLDENDMVCDYKALKLLVSDLVERLDHTMALNSTDPFREGLEAIGDRVVLFTDEDPTTEVLARWLYHQIAARLAERGWVKERSAGRYKLPEDLELESVRVWETSSSWAEYVGSEWGPSGG
ncbi:MAG: 6-carboxytetrahydropterin synthase [Thermoanaerobaculales bacterium]|nr:6-carboxytetrahydropterin synthase [Thermoanaerobaculales bacterium]